MAGGANSLNGTAHLYQSHCQTSGRKSRRRGNDQDSWAHNGFRCCVLTRFVSLGLSATPKTGIVRLEFMRLWRTTKHENSQTGRKSFIFNTHFRYFHSSE
jgi:hypothetical protein